MNAPCQLDFNACISGVDDGSSTSEHLYNAPCAGMRFVNMVVVILWRTPCKSSSIRGKSWTMLHAVSDQ
jgi:hypothetical protein